MGDVGYEHALVFALFFAKRCGGTSLLPNDGIHFLCLQSNDETLALTYQEGTRMRYAEAYSQSRIKAKILIGGGYRTIGPGVSGDVT